MITPPVATVPIMVVPAPQVTHEGDPCGLLVPAPHVLQVVPIPLYVPGAHMVHVLELAGEEVPAPQFMQNPPPSLYLPAGQELHILLSVVTP